ncbi:MAG: DUF3108 domain-containing protein [Marinilabiliales bacterium]|nr:DUF3108 domain-containing protein [Marinilabiliales bacterium]
MKIRSLVFLMLWFLIRPCGAQDIQHPPMKARRSFMAGEFLTYQIRYGFIVGGITTLSLTDTLYNGKSVFHARAIGQTTGLANTLFGVRDVYQSWFDKETGLPWKQSRDIKEGHYKLYNEVTYNRNDNTVLSKLSGLHKVPENILDLTSTYYFLRQIDFSRLKKGDVISVTIYFADEITPFRLKYNGRDTLRTKLGKIPCLKVSPVVEVGRIFKKQDDLTFWFSDDDNCIPVEVKMDIRVAGEVTLKLIKVSNIVNPETLILQEK